MGLYEYAYKHYVEKIQQLDNGLDEKTNLKLRDTFRKNNSPQSKYDTRPIGELFFVKARGDSKLEDLFHKHYDDLLGIDCWVTYVPLEDHVNWKKLFPEKNGYPANVEILDTIVFPDAS